MPRKSGGAVPPATYIGKYYDTSTYVSSPGCMRMVNAYYSPQYIPPVSNSNKPATLHTTFLAHNTFETYSSYDDTDFYQQTTSGYSLPALLEVVSEDLSDYSHISFYAKANESASIDFAFVTDYGGGESGWTVRTTSALIKNFWSSFEMGLPTKMKGIITGSADYSDTDAILMIPRGVPSCDIWIDDIYFIDMAEDTEKETWINMNITELSFSRNTNVNVETTAGRYGDVVYSANPDNRRGRITFRTFATEDDEDVAFLENAQKHATELYLRLPDGDKHIKVMNIEHGMRESWKGLTRNITFDFIEV